MKLVTVHARVAPGKRSTDPSDYSVGDDVAAARGGRRRRGGARWTTTSRRRAVDDDVAAERGGRRRRGGTRCGFTHREREEVRPARRSRAERLVDVPLPWACTRLIYALLRLCKSSAMGAPRRSAPSALAFDVIDVHRVARMLETTKTPVSPSTD
ncbi:hypothetical protein WME94_28510 [Sorangium sp. So ce429]